MSEEFHHDSWMDIQREQQAPGAVVQLVTTNVGKLSLSQIRLKSSGRLAASGMSLLVSMGAPSRK
jgi:hypothetical protein